MRQTIICSAGTPLEAAMDALPPIYSACEAIGRSRITRSDADVPVRLTEILQQLHLALPSVDALGSLCEAILNDQSRDQWTAKFAKLLDNGRLFPTNERVDKADSPHVHLKQLTEMFLDKLQVGRNRRAWVSFGLDREKALRALNSAFRNVGRSRIDALFAGVGGRASGLGSFGSLLPKHEALESLDSGYLAVHQPDCDYITLSPVSVCNARLVVLSCPQGDGRETVAGEIHRLWLAKKEPSPKLCRELPALVCMKYLPANGAGSKVSPFGDIMGDDVKDSEEKDAQVNTDATLILITDVALA